MKFRNRRSSSASPERPTDATASSPKIANKTQKLEVLSHRRDINENITAAFRSLERGDSNDTKRRLYAIQQNILGFEQYLSATIEPKDYAQIRLSDSTIARKVFAIPELLESILRHLDVPDLMRCYGVSRTFRDALETSKKLQICLFLLPDTEARKQRFPQNTKRFSCGGFESNFGPGSATIKIPTRLGRFHKIGSRWKKMLVRQPPIYSMRCHAICHEVSTGDCMLSWRNGDRHTIRSDEGLTMGDIFEAVGTMFNKHSRCEENHGRPRRITVYFDGPEDRFQV